MRKALKYEVFDKYPKGNETRYDTSDPKPVTPIEIVERRMK